MFQKAYISTYDMDKRDINTDKKQQVDFNPATYTISSQNQYQTNRAGLGKKSRIEYSFLKGMSATLSFELVFDSYVHGADEGSMENVNDKLKKLRGFAKKDSDKHAPPYVIFVWGNLSFAGVITSISETFTMFLGDGKPVRAKVNMTITGCRTEDIPPIPNHSPDRTRLYTVAEDDTLWSIADDKYSSCYDWIYIAIKNRIDNPRKLEISRRLVIPSLPLHEAYGDNIWLR